MTGVYGQFKPSQVARETRPGFYGLEISCLPIREAALEVSEYANSDGPQVAIHVPFMRGYHRAVLLHALVTSPDEGTRKTGFDALQRGTLLASEIGRHRADLVTDSQLGICYKWVRETPRHSCLEQSRKKRGGSESLQLQWQYDP